MLPGNEYDIDFIYTYWIYVLDLRIGATGTGFYRIFTTFYILGIYTIYFLLYGEN